MDVVDGLKTHHFLQVFMLGWHKTARALPFTIACEVGAHNLMNSMVYDTYIYIYAGWWLSWYTYPSEKYESWSVGMMKFPIYENIKSVPNHQSYIYIYIHSYTML